MAGEQSTAYDSRRGSRPGGHGCYQDDRLPHRPSPKIRRLPRERRRLGNLAGANHAGAAWLAVCWASPEESRVSPALAMWSNHGHLAAPLGPGCDAGREGEGQQFELRGRMAVASDAYDVCFVDERQATVTWQGVEKGSRCLLCGNRAVLRWKAYARGRCEHPG